MSQFSANRITWNDDPQILLIGRDPNLQCELANALAGVPEARPVINYQPDYRWALESARSLRPELVLIQMSKDISSLKTFVEECGRASPASAVVLVFHGDVFGEELSESEFLIDVLRSGVRDFLRRPLAPEDIRRLLERLRQLRGI